MKKKLNFVDLFAGAGGLSCGLEMAGLRCILGVEYDKYAAETFKRNHSHAHVWNKDIVELTKNKLLMLLQNQKIDLVVGGPPCQGFSTAGRGNPKDKRNSLFLEFVRIVKHLDPKYIIVENVTGLLAKKNEHTLRAIFHEFESLGYILNVKVMSAEKYGVPERRRRTIILGAKDCGVPIFPKESERVSTVGDAFKNLRASDGNFYNHDEAKAAIKDKMDLKRLQFIPEGDSIRYYKDQVKYLPPKCYFDVDFSTLKEERFRQAKLYRLDRKLPSPTIMTQRTLYYHPTENRYLTQREGAAIQSFPPDFVFEGPLSAQWRQIGNAVPPLLGKALGEAILLMSRRKVIPQERLSFEAKVQGARGSAFCYEKW